MNTCRFSFPPTETLTGVDQYLLRINMSDTWQECMDLCVEVAKKAGEVCEYSALLLLTLFQMVETNTESSLRQQAQL